MGEKSAIASFNLAQNRCEQMVFRNSLDHKEQMKDLTGILENEAKANFEYRNEDIELSL